MANKRLAEERGEQLDRARLAMQAKDAKIKELGETNEELGKALENEKDLAARLKKMKADAEADVEDNGKRMVHLLEENTKLKAEQRDIIKAHGCMGRGEAPGVGKRGCAQVHRCSHRIIAPLHAVCHCIIAPLHAPLPLTSSLPQAEVHRRCKQEIDKKNKTMEEHSEAQAAAEANATKLQEELRGMQEEAADVHGELQEQEAKCARETKRAEQETKRADREYDQRKQAQRKEKEEKKEHVAEKERRQAKEQALIKEQDSHAETKKKLRDANKQRDFQIQQKANEKMLWERKLAESQAECDRKLEESKNELTEARKAKGNEDKKRAEAALREAEWRGATKVAEKLELALGGKTAQPATKRSKLAQNVQSNQGAAEEVAETTVAWATQLQKHSQEAIVALQEERAATTQKLKETQKQLLTESEQATSSAHELSELRSEMQNKKGVEFAESVELRELKAQLEKKEKLLQGYARTDNDLARQEADLAKQEAQKNQQLTEEWEAEKRKIESLQTTVSEECTARLTKERKEPQNCATNAALRHCCIAT